MAANAGASGWRLPQTSQLLRSVAPSAARRPRRGVTGVCARQIDPDVHQLGVGRTDGVGPSPAQQTDRMVRSKTDRGELLDADGPGLAATRSSNMLAMPSPRQSSATATATAALLACRSAGCARSRPSSRQGRTPRSPRGRSGPHGPAPPGCDDQAARAKRKKRTYRVSAPSQANQLVIAPSSPANQQPNHDARTVAHDHSPGVRRRSAIADSVGDRHEPGS
jgi:hypothetical protein